MEKRHFIVLFLLLQIGFKPAMASTAKISTDFEENKGQVSTSTGNRARDVRFSLRLPQAVVYFFDDRISFVLNAIDSVFRIDRQFLSLNPQTRLVGFEKVPACSNYYLSSNFIENVPSYSSLCYQNIAKNVDLRCSVHESRLHLSLLLHPGAQLSDVRMAYTAIQVAGINSGNISIGFDQGNPVLFEILDNAEMRFKSEASSSQPGAYSLEQIFVDNSTLDNSDKQREEEQIINSVVQFSSYFGGSGEDSAYAAVTTSTGMVACGSTSSSNFPISTGASQNALKGSRDAFVTRFESSGKIIWSTYLGGGGDDAALSCASANAKVYVAGRTSSTSDLATPSSLQSTFAGGSSDGFVASFDESSGVRIACSYYGGSEFDECRSVGVRSNGDVAIVGTTLTKDLNMTTHQKQLTGGADAFLCLLDPTLASKRWSTYYGGRFDEEGRGVSSLEDGSIILCGNTSSPNSNFYIAENTTEGNSLPGNIQTNGFLARFSSDGQRMWGRYVGGDSYDTITCITCSKSSIFLAGFTRSNFGGANPMNGISAKSVQPIKGGGVEDGFVSKFNNNGSLAWGSFQGGSGNDRCYGISLAPNDEVIVCGQTESTDFPLINSDQLQLKGGIDAFISYFLKDGSERAASIIIGGSSDECATGTAYQSDGTILMCGTTSSNNFPLSNASQTSNAGISDVFLTRFEKLHVVGVVSEQSSSDDFLFYPNPTIASITLKTNKQLREPTEYKILNLEGELILSQTLQPSSETFTVDIHSLPAGVYVFTLLSDTSYYHKVFVKD